MNQNSVGYSEPVYDPFFIATGANKTDNFINGDNYVNVIGCIDQDKFCNTATHACTPFGGAEQLRHTASHIGLNPAQTASALRLLNSIASSHTYNSVQGLSGMGTVRFEEQLIEISLIFMIALLANELVSDIVSNGLPSNQWQLEVTRWFETSLSNIQAHITQFVAGKVGLGPLAVITKAEDLDDNPPGIRAAYVSQCNNQLIQSSREVQSFSFLGLMIVVWTTIILLIAALSVEQCFVYFRGSSISHRSVALQTDDKMHLLRLALKDQTESWSNGSYQVPTASTDVPFDRPSMHQDGLAWYNHLDSNIQVIGGKHDRIQHEPTPSDYETSYMIR
jgi:hypothetical protein